LDEILKAAHVEVPGLDDEAFVAALHRSGDLDRVHAADLAVAVHAAGGAIEQLERRHAAAITRTCRRFVQPGYSEDDLRQILRTKLFVGLTPKIADYVGNCSLDAWLRVVATREFIDLTRRKDRPREVSAADDELAEALAPNDVLLETIKAEHRKAVVEALFAAVRALDPAERHLLRQHLVSGLTIDQLADVLHVHRATVARRIARARDLLAQHTRDLVAERLGVAPESFAEVYELVRSQFELSVSKLFATPVAS
jgi:RNA polymerase sigma-70 factor (ECF subfamily)